MCCLKPYAGYRASYSTRSRSRVTLATMDAAAIATLFASPLMIVSAGHGILAASTS